MKHKDLMTIRMRRSAMLLLMTLLSLGMWAQTLTVAGVDATNSTALEEAFGSTVTYSDNTLTLNGATITASGDNAGIAIDNSGGGEYTLCINIIGTNKITTTGTQSAIYCSGGDVAPQLTFMKGGDDCSLQLTSNGVTVISKGFNQINGIRSIDPYAGDLLIADYEARYESQYQGLYYVDEQQEENPITSAQIITYQEYGITITNNGSDIAITAITSKNKKGVLTDNTTGNTTVLFDGRNTLILNGANIGTITIEPTNTLTGGLNVYLKGSNTISGTYIIDANGNNASVPVSFTTNEVTPGNLTFTYTGGAALLDDVDGAFRNVTTSYKNGLTAILDHNMEGNQVVTLSVTLKPIIVAETGENGVTFAGDGDDSNGKGLGEDIQGVGDPESPSEKAVEVNNIYYTLGTGDGYYVDAERDNLKIVALNTKMTGVPNYLPGTAEFLANFKGMTFLLPAGTGTVTVEACTYGGGILNVQIGDDAPVQFTDLTNFTECKVPYVITEPTYVFIYNSAPAASSRTFDDRRAPGRKETTTVGIGGLNISASSVDAVPEPALSPKMLDKSLVATWISGNHVTVNDTDVEDLNDDAFDDLTGGAAASRRAIAPSFITYVDLTGTAIKNKEVDRTALPFSKLNENTFIYMPAGNTIKAGTKNVVIGSVCDEMELKQENQLEVAKNFTALEASLDRTFDTEKTGTIYLPFALKEEKATEMGKFYELTSYDGSTVSMTSVASTKANTPYMFKPAKTTLSAEMVDVKKDLPASPTAGGITFKGTYEENSIKSDETKQYYCFMADGDKAGKFVHVTGTAVTVSPYRAYMVKSGASARDLDVIIDGFATGVSVVKDIRSKMDNVFYDLSGRRVMYPTKGLYIVNGKKVIIK